MAASRLQSLALSSVVIVATCGVAVMAARSGRGVEAPRPDDVFADAQAFVLAVYPDLPRQGHVIWFRTFPRALETIKSAHVSFFALLVESAAHLHAQDHATTTPSPVLQAFVNIGPDGQMTHFQASGSEHTNRPRIEALGAVLTRNPRRPDEDIQREMVNSGMRFPPGQRDALLAYVRPVLAEIERRAGRLEIESIEPPRRDVEEYAGGPKATAVLAWVIDAHAQRGREGRTVVVSFEPFDGRLTSLTITAP